MKRLLVLSAGFAIMASSQVFAAGYEKSIPWGGRSAGMGGIATPYISGSQALFFNPAGLVSENVGQDISFNISPTSSQFSGPIVSANTTMDSESKILTPLGLIYGATLNDKLGFGVGGYISGGSYANYENATFSTGTANVKTDLQVAEVAAGVGYRLTPDLKVGLAVRYVQAKANFSVVQRLAAAPTYFVNADFKDLEDSNFGAFKLGAQYKINESTSLGLSYRSKVDLEAKGKVSGTAYLPGGMGGTMALTESDASAKTTFPQQVSLGAMHKISDSWNAAAELVWTEYSVVDRVEIGATILGNAAGDLQQRWSNQWNLRLGGEYLGYDHPIRFGYVYTNTVTAPEWARASFTPAGPAHTFTLGSNYKVADNIELDGGFEYTTVSADIGSGNSIDILAGEYSATAYAAHLGLTYSF